METESLYAFLDSLVEVNDGVLISKTDCGKVGNNTEKVANTMLTGPYQGSYENRELLGNPF